MINLVQSNDNEGSAEEVDFSGGMMGGATMSAGMVGSSDYGGAAVCTETEGSHDRGGSGEVGGKAEGSCMSSSTREESLNHFTRGPEDSGGL